MKYAFWIGAVLMIAATLMMIRARILRVRRRGGFCPQCGAALPNVGAPRCPVCGENT